jgi:D-sedoheptulose 7-phosphate isomerase
MGNGGSAADAQHLAAELVVRFTRERRAFASIALTTDTSILTAAANDYSFTMIFSRQLEALCGPGDSVVAISTSGNSPNVIAGLRKAREIGAYTVAFTGNGGGDMKNLAHAVLDINSTTTARIQEAHILIGHILCDWLEAALAGESHRV